MIRRFKAGGMRWLALRVITDRTNPKMDWIGQKNGFAGWPTRGLILAGNGTIPGLLGRF